MKVFLWVTLVLTILSILCKLVFLWVGDYPRRQEHSSGEDALAMLVNSAVATWIVYLLYVITASS